MISGIDASTTNFVFTVLELKDEVEVAGIIPVSEVPKDELGNPVDIHGVIYDDKDPLESPYPDEFTLYPVILLGYMTYGHKYCWLGDRKGEDGSGFTAYVRIDKNEDGTKEASIELEIPDINLDVTIYGDGSVSHEFY